MHSSRSNHSPRINVFRQLYHHRRPLAMMYNIDNAAARFQRWVAGTIFRDSLEIITMKTIQYDHGHSHGYRRGHSARWFRKSVVHSRQLTLRAGSISFDTLQCSISPELSSFILRGWPKLINSFQ